jgi:hypothetical protein
MRVPRSISALGLDAAQALRMTADQPTGGRGWYHRLGNLAMASIVEFQTVSSTPEEHVALAHGFSIRVRRTYACCFGEGLPQLAGTRGPVMTGSQRRGAHEGGELFSRQGRFPLKHLEDCYQTFFRDTCYSNKRCHES